MGRSHTRTHLTALTTALSNRTGVSLLGPSLVQFGKGQF
ncbi:hypothetical protein F383_15639 [Gossypium arboreum]|uniref:Uncharacterized protein n=1 Tax=Gossypium arboreum TaxID=29729 RepID=A0A0B0N663_GOSAR|nr:hypothetical protein F383_15639 [Gossypium arboreum]